MKSMKRRRALEGYAIVVMAFSTVASGYANPLKKLAHAASGLGKAVVSVASLPVKTTVVAGSVVTMQKSPKNGAKDFVGAVTAVPISIGKAVNTSAEAAGAMANLPADFTKGLLAYSGDPGKIIGNLVTTPYYFLTGVGTTFVSAGGNLLQGANPLELNPASVALASLIRDAHDRHEGDSKPLPANIRNALAQFYPPEILSKTRYAISSPEDLDLPDVVDNLQDSIGGYQRFAVTVDDIIVFSAEPPHNWSGIQWWGHELHHVEQYSALGIDKFAYQYTIHHNDIETEAINKGTMVANAVQAQGIQY
jgi:hypothetical protein